MKTPPAITGSTQIVGLLGWPVSHSLSPAMHNAAFAHLELDWRYVPLPVDPARPGAIPQAVAGLRALGLRGANVTVPHKQAVMGCVDRLTPAAEAIGAVNTLVGREGRLAAGRQHGRRRLYRRPARPRGGSAGSACAGAGRRRLGPRRRLWAGTGRRGADRHCQPYRRDGPGARRRTAATRTGLPDDGVCPSRRSTRACCAGGPDRQLHVAGHDAQRGHQPLARRPAVPQRPDRLRPGL